MTQKRHKKDAGAEVFDNIMLFLYVAAIFNGKVLINGIRKMGIETMILRLPWLLVIAMLLAWQFWHLRFLMWLAPDIFHYKLMLGIERWGYWNNVWAIMGISLATEVWIRGFFQTIKLRRWQGKLDKIGLKNGLKESNQPSRC